MQQPVKYFSKRLNSTNLYASELLLKPHRKEAFWVRTDDQFSGRGQGSKTWSSEPGLNLTGSMVVFPEKFNASSQFILSKTFALAAADFLELFIEEVKIKWPNDLYVGDSKIGGILIETAILGKYIESAILGVGININQVNFSKNIPNPVSLRGLTDMDYDLTELEDLLITSFKNKYVLLESGDYDEINSEYLSKLYRFGEFTEFKTRDKIISARIIGVSEFGHLIIQTDTGTLMTFDYQEIEYLLTS